MKKLLLIGALAAQMLLADKWVVSWTGSAHGPYPLGNAVAQPDLKEVLPGAAAEDQTFRMIVRPALWGRFVRIRLTNIWGKKPVTFDGVYIGAHAMGGALLPNSNRAVKFRGGSTSVTIAPGEFAWSDPVDLDYVKLPAGIPAGNEWLGRKLAVSFHAVGVASTMTWHAKAMQTSYLSRPKAGSHGAEETADSFPFSTTSWYFLDALEAMAPEATRVVLCYGDSITDGTNSTINGDDRWPDMLANRLLGKNVVVVNAGIGGNRVIGPVNYAANAISGGPSALERLETDVTMLSGVSTVIWLEGINDLGGANTSPQDIIDGFSRGIVRLHQKGIRVIGATITSSLGSTPTHGTPEVDAQRRAINDFIRHGGKFDSIADFDAATLDPKTGGLRAEFKPSSSTGGPGDGLHPNRAGYQAMANSIDLKKLF